MLERGIGGGQAIAAVFGFDPLTSGLGQGLAEPRQVGQQRRCGSIRSVVILPEVFGEPIDCHDLIGPDGQQRQQPTLAKTADAYRLTVVSMLMPPKTRRKGPAGLTESMSPSVTM